jgi:acetyl-CoA carboxylase carboxyltransferase component
MAGDPVVQLVERDVEAVAAAAVTADASGPATLRQDLADLCDPDSFLEYGPLAIAPQRRNRSLEDLIANTPADGLIAGIATVNAQHFGETRARCVLLSYDYTVLAGTQGHEGHRKDGRMFELAEQWRLPVVFFAEGGGGRPGDTEIRGDGRSFNQFGRLSGKVPLVGVVSGNCFAGNAAFLGACDVIIATPDASIGMGGPVMIEGAGLGQVAAREVGPAAMHAQCGVVDVLADGEADAVAAARRYLSYFQGDLPPGEPADQTLLRGVVPEDRRRAYDVRRVIEVLADAGSVLELR